jgi:hypothetical protein
LRAVVDLDSLTVGHLQDSVVNGAKHAPDHSNADVAGRNRCRPAALAVSGVRDNLDSDRHG